MEGDKGFELDAALWPTAGQPLPGGMAAKSP